MKQCWASSITSIWTGQGCFYLALVMDLYSRRIVGWSLSWRISRHLVLKALAMALGRRQVEGELVDHSDHGVQYLSDDFQALLQQHGIDCSLSSAGSCYDSADLTQLSTLSMQNQEAVTGVAREPISAFDPKRPLVFASEIVENS